MKVNVQDRTTKLYALGDGWTTDPNAATDFHATVRALEFCARRKCDANVVLNFREVNPSGSLDVVIGMGAVKNIRLDDRLVPKMASAAGVEPATCCFGDSRSSD